MTVELPDDGLEFDVDTIRTEVMREQADYHGVRARVQARLATATPMITLDLSFAAMLTRLSYQRPLPHRTARRRV